jgi:formate/nitrite transporter FocA (FNT family)
MLSLLKRRDTSTLLNVLRLWGVVLIANLLGAAVVALAVSRTTAFDPDVREAFAEIGRASVAHGFGTTLIRGIFAGWLIALLVWVLPYAEAARFFVILALTWLVGAAEFSHIVAGAVDTFALAWTGEATWPEVFGRFIVPTLLGNIIGGVTLVAGLNHAQVCAGQEEKG